MAGVTLTSTGPAASREGERQPPITFDAVYECYAATVARWVARLGGPGPDVEDLTQEIFLVVDRRLSGFRRESRLSTWLFSITAKIVANDRRRRRFRGWLVRLVPNVGERAVDGADTPIERLEKRERCAQFYQALDAVGERQRRALVLFELEDMSIADIADLMGLRPGGVRVLLHRARRRFLKEMTARELDQAAQPDTTPGTERPR